MIHSDFPPAGGFAGSQPFARIQSSHSRGHSEIGPSAGDIRPEIDGLRIAPCIPKAWKGFTMTRIFRGRKIHIDVKNPQRKCRGLKSLKVDGEAIKGDVIPTGKLKDGSKVVAVLG